MNKTYKIDEKLFFNLVRYFYLENDTNELKNEITKQIEAKIDSLWKHELYSKYKDKTLTDQEREKARQEYLDAVGILPSFRW